ncbi:hypothetical protein [Streptomyces uncialis]|uniref:hypothetical protein n=1 Tax=Streptomyces uncialis TaxID=1048205 RepID=UPI0037BB0A84
MNRDDHEDALVTEAADMLAAGRDAKEVFVELAARTGEWDAGVLAVCLALGVPREDAEARVHGARPFFEEFAVGEEDSLAMLLGIGQVFVVDRVLDDDHQRISDLLGTAVAARGGCPAGVHGWFRGGEITKIFLYLAKTRFGNWNERGSPREFWAPMVAAGELLIAVGGPHQAEVMAGLERCRDQAATAGGRAQMRR